ncbi:hypothetical protein [Mycobacterium sp. URHB0044]|jgi:hypothetical protein|uniref:hypothetical protein n=1 Tax=Mycobacterium sp. URHB0044 TaxID=1380386 RepID=UPI001E2D13A5|nr:hypothetical protein [Mycobacterium sp. URHB0044]
MTGQTTSSKSLTQPPNTGRHRSESERPASRAIGAALAAIGLALTVSLYPLPHGPELFDMFTPDQESVLASLSRSKPGDAKCRRECLQDRVSTPFIWCVTASRVGMIPDPSEGSPANTAANTGETERWLSKWIGRERIPTMDFVTNAS